MSKTQIMFVLDRSGSMSICAKDAVGGFNAFLEEQQKLPKGKRFSLLQFDHENTFTYREARLSDCKPLVLGNTYIPRGNTALYDAIKSAIDTLGLVEKAILVIYTDGEENASKTTSEQIKKMISRVKERGWEVLFLASDLKAVETFKQVYNDWTKIAYVDKHWEGSGIRGMSNFASAYSVGGAGSTQCMNAQAVVNDQVDQDNSSENV